MKFNRNITTQIDNSKSFYFNSVVDTYAQKELKRLSLRQLAVFGRNVTNEKLINSGNYLRTELPVRLAHRIKEFQTLPLIVGINPHIQAVYSLYWHAFEELKKIEEIRNIQDNDEFCIKLKELLNQHSIVLDRLFLGMAEVESKMDAKSIDEFLERTLLSRISRRVLSEQHLLLSKKSQNGIENVILKNEIDIRKIVNKCGVSAGISLENIQLHCENNNIQFTHIPRHIEFILTRLFKNSLIESNKPPTIKITVTGFGQNEEDIMFRISDQVKINYGLDWRFSQLKNKDKGLIMTPMYIHYLKGSLKLHNLNGYGNDIFLKLPKFGTQLENLDFP